MIVIYSIYVVSIILNILARSSIIFNFFTFIILYLIDFMISIYIFMTYIIINIM